MGTMLPPDSCKVYTPRTIADAMVGALQPDRGATWLEPSVGRGVFLLALADAGVDRSKVVAIDLDPERCDTDSLARTQRAKDFLAWSQSTRNRFDRIVGNPPFVPLSQVDPQLKKVSTGIRLPGVHRTVPLSSNAWSAFLCSSLRLLRDGGNIAFVLPAAWDYADYAAPLREHIPGLFREFFIFRSHRPLFEDVQEGTVILVGRGYRDQHAHYGRIECCDKEGLVAKINSIRVTATFSLESRLSKLEDGDHGVPLGQLAEIRLGGVTGQADYFLLTEEQRRFWKLPLEAVSPVLSRSRHLTGAVIDARSWQTLLRMGERIWLFRPTGETCFHPAVRSYLSRSEARGGCKRNGYKIIKRSPWYVTPLPPEVDGFVSGMTKSGPWIALRRMEFLNATNTLYVVRFKDRMNYRSKCAIALAFLTSAVRETLRRRCRHYPDGLMKHEPSDLMSVRIPLARDASKAPIVYSRAVTSMIEGEIDKAASLADHFFRL